MCEGLAESCFSMNAQQAMTRLKVLMREIGEVEDRDDRFFEVYSVRNAGAGVTINVEPVRVKITIELAQARRVPYYMRIAGQMRVTRSMSASRAYAILGVNHGARRFFPRVRWSRNPWNHGGIEMAVWNPNAPVDEELMQKCKSFVKHVFDHN